MEAEATMIDEARRLGTMLDFHLTEARKLIERMEALGRSPPSSVPRRSSAAVAAHRVPRPGARRPADARRAPRRLQEDPGGDAAVPATEVDNSERYSGSQSPADSLEYSCCTVFGDVIIKI
jgi:hypothetical protein